jgi:hypothetical protein
LSIKHEALSSNKRQPKDKKKLEGHFSLK